MTTHTAPPRTLPFELGEPRAFRGLTVIPLVAAEEPTLEYVGLDEAVSRGLEITEVDADGVVGTLAVTNPLDVHVLLYEGEELVGAKQNRILSQTILVAAGATQKIPATCVERGRWSHRTAHFQPAPRAAYPELRKAQRAGQSAAWASVSAKSVRLDASSPTEAAEAMYVSRGASLEEYVQALPRLDGQAGVLAGIGGRIACLDYVSRSAAWPDIIVVAPATCNSIGKLSAGISDNFALLVVRAAPRATPVIVVPSMNTEMWYDPQFQRSIDLLNETAKYRVLSPTEGQMLRGEQGFGAQVPLADVVHATYLELGIVGTPAEVVLSRDLRAEAREGTVVLVEEDAEVRRQIAEALRRLATASQIEQFDNAAAALTWMRAHDVALVVTELEFSQGPTGWDIVDHFRRLGARSGVQLIVTNSAGRKQASAEQLARYDVHFQPKPLNVDYLARLIVGCLHGARPSETMVRRTLQAGEVLFREGDPGSHVFFVESGRLTIVKNRNGTPATIGSVGESGVVGEMAFLGEGVRFASAIAESPTELVETTSTRSGATSRTSRYGFGLSSAA